MSAAQQKALEVLKENARDMTVHSMVKTFGLHVTLYKTVAKEHNIKLYSASELSKRRVWQLANKGMENKQIALELNMHHGTICNIVKSITPEDVAHFEKIFGKPETVETAFVDNTFSKLNMEERILMTLEKPNLHDIDRERLTHMLNVLRRGDTKQKIQREKTIVTQSRGGYGVYDSLRTDIVYKD